MVTELDVFWNLKAKGKKGTEFERIEGYIQDLNETDYLIATDSDICWIPKKKTELLPEL